MNSAKIQSSIIDKKGNIISGKIKKKDSQNKKSYYWEYSISGFYFIAPIIAFLIIGIFLDNTFGKKPLFTVFFIFIGMFASFYNLYRIIKQ
jgi:F0F1-type ATP synthase assembly protein I